VSATLFDYNGVLVDDEAVHLAAFRDVLEPRGIQISDADYWEKYLGFDDREAFIHILREHGQAHDRQVVDALIQDKKPRYLERASHVLKAFDGAAELLRLRARRGPVVIVSGALRDEIELGLSVLEVGHLVSGIVSAEDTARSKPDPEGYELGIRRLQELGVAEARAVAVVFEDSIDGIRAAKSARLRCVGIAHSYPAARLVDAGADSVVAHIADVKLAHPELVAEA
jgi:beta-phosphoglucomutase